MLAGIIVSMLSYQSHPEKEAARQSDYLFYVLLFQGCF